MFTRLNSNNYRVSRMTLNYMVEQFNIQLVPISDRILEYSRKLHCRRACDASDILTSSSASCISWYGAGIIFLRQNSVGVTINNNSYDLNLKSKLI